jgi:hypothetical protein
MNNALKMSMRIADRMRRRRRHHGRHRRRVVAAAKKTLELTDDEDVDE